MTKITVTSAAVSLPRPGRRRLNLPKLKIGRALASIFISIGDAITLAYVAPFQTYRQNPPATLHTNSDGRDPSW